MPSKVPAGVSPDAVAAGGCSLGSTNGDMISEYAVVRSRFEIVSVSEVVTVEYVSLTFAVFG